MIVLCIVTLLPGEAK